MQIIKADKKPQYKTIKASELNEGDWFEYDGKLVWLMYKGSSYNFAYPENIGEDSYYCIASDYVDEYFSPYVYLCDTKIIYEKMLL